MHALSVIWAAAVRRLRGQEGMVLPMAMMVLVVIGLLAAVVSEEAINSSGQAGTQLSSRAAVGAADAGVQIAANRLSAAANLPGSALNSSDCYTHGSPAQNTTLPTSNVCPAQGDSLGNNGGYSYTVVPITSASVPCTGWWVNGNGQDLNQYCITSVGTYDGVKRRVQERVVNSPTGATFPYNGMVSLYGIDFNNAATITGDVVSNAGVINFNNNVTISHGTVTTGPSGSVTNTQHLTCTNNCSVSQSGTQITVPPTDPSPYSDSATTNNDAAINWGSSGIYTASTRTVNATGSVGSSSSPIIFPSGIYNFCEFHLNNTAWLQVPAGASVKIYIDSPYRTGSGCAAGTGDFNINNTLSWTNLTNDPTNLQISAYGNPSGAAAAFQANPSSPGQWQPDFEFNNSVNVPLVADIYAPNSWINLNNTVNMAGALVGGYIKANNSTTFGGASGGASGGNPSDTFYPVAWHQCPSTWSGTDQAAGCAS